MNNYIIGEKILKQLDERLDDEDLNVEDLNVATFVLPNVKQSREKQEVI